jgi:hypothetical protein
MNSIGRGMTGRQASVKRDGDGFRIETPNAASMPKYLEHQYNRQKYDGPGG